MEIIKVLFGSVLMKLLKKIYSVEPNLWLLLLATFGSYGLCFGVLNKIKVLQRNFWLGCFIYIIVFLVFLYLAKAMTYLIVEKGRGKK